MSVATMTPQLRKIHINSIVSRSHPSIRISLFSIYLPFMLWYPLEHYLRSFSTRTQKKNSFAHFLLFCLQITTLPPQNYSHFFLTHFKSNLNTPWNVLSSTVNSNDSSSQLFARIFCPTQPQGIAHPATTLCPPYNPCAISTRTLTTTHTRLGTTYLVHCHALSLPLEEKSASPWVFSHARNHSHCPSRRHGVDNIVQHMIISLYGAIRWYNEAKYVSGG